MNNRQVRLLTSICKGTYDHNNILRPTSLAVYPLPNASGSCPPDTASKLSLAIIVVWILVIDIALAIAGVIITILDRNQINRMKQFGDINDLISRI
jgi:hypothetical protein